MALIDKPSGTGGVNSVGITDDTIMLSISIALAVMGAANDDGMSNVTADEVDQNMLPMA